MSPSVRYGNGAEEYQVSPAAHIDPRKLVCSKSAYAQDPFSRSAGSRETQLGYMLEIPVLMAVVVIGLTILIPMLTPLWRKVALCIGTVPVVAGLYYMIVVPGWTPGRRLGPPWNILVFIIVAGLLIFGVATYVLAGS